MRYLAVVGLGLVSVLWSVAVQAQAQEPPPPDPLSLAAEYLSHAHQTYREVTGTNPLSPREVSDYLQKELGNKETTKVVTFENNGFVSQAKLVRTGTSKDGRPEGYVLMTTTAPTGHITTQFEGMGSSWVRQGIGDKALTVVVRKRNGRGQTAQAGALITHTKEALGRSRRVTTIRQLVSGRYQRLTRTERADGRKERYQYDYNPQTGLFSETRLRRSSDGKQRRLQKRFDGEKLTTQIEANGKLTSKQTYTLPQELEPQQQFRRYKDESWTWRDVHSSQEATGVIHATGKEGRLGEVTSQFVSPLGTGYGKVKQTHYRIASKPPTNEHPTVTREYAPGWLEPMESVPPEGRVKSLLRKVKAITPKNVYLRFKLRKARKLIESASGKRFPKVVLQPQLGEDAFAFTDQRNRIEVGSEMAKSDLPTLVNVLGHESKHIDDGRWSIKVHSTDEKSLCGIGSVLEAKTAQLSNANITRLLERRADAKAGKTLGKVFQKTGDRKMNPNSVTRGFQKAGGNWTPEQDYDPPRLRRRTIINAYRRQIRGRRR